ncbi:MAG: hypothetical protein QXU88_02690 [Candidatus Woesearchaeota archaeon]
MAEKTNEKALVFDAGPIISLTTNNLLWILAELKERFKGRFYIVESVRRELIDKPITTKKFKFEALQVEQLIESDVLTVASEQKAKEDAIRFMTLANSSLVVNQTPLKLVQLAEMESIAFGLRCSAQAIVIDEKTTRLLVENPEGLARLLSKRLHVNVKIDKEALSELHAVLDGIRFIRSVELAAAAYALGILDRFVVKVPDARTELVDSVLWGLKLNGCAISEHELSDLTRLALEQKQNL